CLVIVDEHPLQGEGGRLHNVGFEALIQLRHRTMLARLARLCENEAEAGHQSPRAVVGATGVDGAGHA
ncbi:polyketide cyclase, partial [Streptomyces sp. WM6386]